MEHQKLFTRISSTLNRAREIIEEERQSYLLGGCVFTNRDGQLVPNLATLRLEFRPIVHQMDRTLGEIDRIAADLATPHCTASSFDASN